MRWTMAEPVYVHIHSGDAVNQGEVPPAEPGRPYRLTVMPLQLSPPVASCAAQRLATTLGVHNMAHIAARKTTSNIFSEVLVHPQIRICLYTAQWQ